MTQPLAFVVCLLASQQALAETCPELDGGWITTSLDPSIEYVARYKVVDEVFHLRLSAKTTGYLGFGFAERSTGHMKGSDLMTVAVVDGKVRAEDRYASWHANTYAPSNYENGYDGLTAELDTHDDWTAISGSEVGDVTEVYVTRPLITGDHQDRDISTGSNRIVWSWSASDVVGFHGDNRGAGMITLSGMSETSIPAHDGSWKFNMKGYQVPSDQVTTYACQGITFPTDKDRHIVAIAPINASKYNHHVIVHICQDNAYFDNHESPQLCSATDSEPSPSGGQGSSPLGSSEAGCSGLLWAWAVGMGPFVFPPEAGFRVGPGDSISKVIMEIHYDNPFDDQNVVDTMGFEAFYVEDTLRAHDIASVIIGDPIVQFGNLADSQSVTASGPYGDLPQGESLIHREATCPTECTDTWDTGMDAPVSEINVFAHFLHMHYYGRKIYTEHYRNDQYLGIPGRRIDFWDNAYQQAQEKPYKVQKGDSLQTHCFYDTSSYSDDTVVEFGGATSNEMCQDFLFYYPALKRNSKPWAMCGITSGGSTLCGSLAQPGGESDYKLDSSTQKVRGTTNSDDDFAQVNKEALDPVLIDVCEPAPPSTPAPPVTFAVVAEGDVNDYTDEVIDGIKASVVSTLGGAGVNSEDVTVTVTSASVLITVDIAVTETSASGVTSQVTTELATTSSATQLVSSQVPSSVLTITVTEVRSIPGDDDGGDDDDDIAVIAGAAAGGAVGALIIAAVLYFTLCKKPKAQVKNPESTQSQTV